MHQLVNIMTNNICYSVNIIDFKTIQIEFINYRKQYINTKKSANEN